MTDAKLRIILDLQADAAKGELAGLASDLKATGAATDDAGRAQNELQLALYKTSDASIQLSEAQAALASNTDPDKQRELEGDVLAAQVALDKEAQSAQALADDLNGVADETDQTSEANDKAGVSFTELNSAMAIGRQALQLGKQAYDAIIQTTLDYADQVRGLSRTIGASAEESSKLIQAADDVFVSFDSLSNGMEAAIRKGFKPTIAGLGEISDKYLSIQDPIERTKFLMDTFGRSGADLAPLMEKGAAGIAKMGQAAEDAGQVLSGADLEATLVNKEAVDALHDSIQGLTIALARDGIPALTNFANAEAGAIQTHNLLNQAVKAGILTNKEAYNLQIQLQYGQKTQAQVDEDLRAKIDKLTEASRNEATVRANLNGLYLKAEPAVRAVASAYNPMIEMVQKATQAYKDEVVAQQQHNDTISAGLQAGLSGAIQSAEQAYQDVIAGTTPEIARLTAEISRYQATQGATVTVTKDATTSAAQYELATIKAAEAQQKFTEYSGDDRAEQLRLQVAAENAEASVIKLGQGFGISKDYTVDHTKAIAEDQTALDALKAKNAEAVAQFDKTTASFILQQIAFLAGPEASLAAAHALGILSDTDYNLAVNVHQLTLDWDLNKSGQIDTAAETAGLTAALVTQKETVERAAGVIPPLTEHIGGLSGQSEEAARKLHDMNAGINDLHDATVNVYFNEIHTSINRSSQDEATALGGGGGGFASGADFVIPPGFPNDSFGPMYAQSGERVQVTPAAMVGAMGGEITVPIAIYLDGDLIAQSVARRQSDASDSRRRLGVS